MPPPDEEPAALRLLQSLGYQQLRQLAKRHGLRPKGKADRLRRALRPFADDIAADIAAEVAVAEAVDSSRESLDSSAGVAATSQLTSDGDNDSSMKENVPPPGHAPPSDASQHSEHSFFYVSDSGSEEQQQQQQQQEQRQRSCKRALPNFAEIHARNFAKMESIADYHSRKAQRANYLLSDPRQPRIQQQQQQPGGASTPQAVIASCASDRRRLQLSAAASGSGRRRRQFDLASSLARPLSWRPHTGPLRPFEPESPAYVRPPVARLQPAAASDCDRAERRQVAKQLTKEKKEQLLMRRRGLLS